MKRYALLILSFFMSSLLYFANLSTVPYFNQLYEFLKYSVHPLLEAKGKVSERARNLWNRYIFLKDVSTENQRLRGELQECEMQRALMLTYQRALTDIAESIDLPFETKSYSLIYANIIAYDPSGNDTFLLIDRGSGSGVSEGMIVFYRDTLVGIVDEAYGSSSRIRTVFSKEFSISSMSGNKAYIYKGDYPYGMLLYVKEEDELEVGDTVFLRLPNKKLPEFVIGRVSQILDEEEGFFKKVYVKPSVDIRRIALCTILKEEL
ncbi:MAG: rod shape-determining protein MreC [Aquificaceae bacterium]